jgi:hypothetical protein
MLSVCKCALCHPLKKVFEWGGLLRTHEDWGVNFLTR